MFIIPNNFKLSKKKNGYPTKVKVIEAAHDNFWSDNTQHKYYSGFLNEKQYIYCFPVSYEANNCYNFLKKYRQVNKRYPGYFNNKLHLKEENYKIFVKDEILDSLKNRCMLNNIGLIGIQSFEFTYIDVFFDQKDVFNVNICGTDLLENEVLDKERQVNYLNYLFLN